MRPTVLLLGSHHWANPGLDAVDATLDDMLTPARQREIAACLSGLAAFRPTKVAIEIAATRDAEINAEYERFRAGAFALTAAEHHQIGFRLAATLGHDRIFPVDWNEGTLGLDTAFVFARDHQPEIYAALMSGIETIAAGNEAATLAAKPIQQLLIDANDPAALRHNHRVYLDIARIGTDNVYAGIDWVKGWYERNLIIYATISRLITRDDDRVLVVYGAGHIPLLTQFFHDADRVDLDPVEPYLR